MLDLAFALASAAQIVSVTLSSAIVELTDPLAGSVETVMLLNVVASSEAGVLGVAP